MRKIAVFAQSSLVGLGISALVGITPGFAYEGQHEMINGQVQKIDAAAGKVTLAHGPIKSLGMDEAMTMVWPVQDANALKSLKAGDKVMFHAESINGTPTVTEIEKTK